MATVTFGGASIWRPGGVYHGSVGIQATPGRNAPRTVPADSALVEDISKNDKGVTETQVWTVNKGNVDAIANMQKWPADVIGQARAAMGFAIPQPVPKAGPEPVATLAQVLAPKAPAAPTKSRVGLWVTVAVGLVAVGAGWYFLRKRKSKGTP